MRALPRPGDLWTAGPLRAVVLSLHAGPPPGFLAFPEPRDASVRWVLVRLYLGSVAVAFEALPVARFVMRYGPAGEAADPVS